MVTEMTLEEKERLIIRDIKEETGINPIKIFKTIAHKDYISMHGPEHHMLDGASLLVAYKNAGNKMPGAMCGLWGVCGAVTSIGAALAIIDKTGPLSTDGSWGDHMSFTAKATETLGNINGPRCCKRDAMLAFRNAVEYINKRYNTQLEYEEQKCEFSGMNVQCIKQRCPFYAENK